MRRISSFVFALAVVLSAGASVPNMYIYRSGGQIEKVELGNGEVPEHQSADEGFRMVTGKTEIPISEIDSCVLRAVDIPTLNITLIDYPDATMLWDKELYLNAVLSIEGNGMIDDLPATSLKIKGRGNTTWSMPKKPMRLKFDKKIQIGELSKAKNLVLLANYIDPTLMKNSLMMWLANSLEIPYSNHALPCEVVINGKSSGSYLLTEKVGINSGSVDIDETIGILFELDVSYDEAYKFHSANFNLPVMVKDPDFDELYEDNPDGLTPEQRLNLWMDDFNKAEALAKQGKGFDAFDLDSFVNYLLVCNFTANSEIGYPKSLYMYKRAVADGELYHIGPLWDFDVAFTIYQNPGNGITKEENHNEQIWLNSLLSSLARTKVFQQAYAKRFREFKENIYPRFMEYLDAYAAMIEPSAKMNSTIWGDDKLIWIYAPSTSDTKRWVGELREWIEKRMTFLESQIEKGTY